MRILILGGDGMFGHQVFKHLKPRHNVKVTLRNEPNAYQDFTIFDADNAIFGIDVRNFERVIEAFAFQPEVVINAIGVIKQQKAAKAFLPCIEINSLFPHKLAMLCKAVGARLIHLSTDCVFSGEKGKYTETDRPDANDLYGRSKLLGEVEESHCLTLRTSIIGWELLRKKSLMEWFVAQNSQVDGYHNAIFSGFTTIELSKIVERCVTQFSHKSGIYHVSADPISKYDLLSIVKRKLNLKISIREQFDFHCNRSLNSSRFREEFCYQAPTWEEMIEELCKARERYTNVS